MKKIIALVLALVMMLAMFAGCGNTAEQPAADAENQPAAEANKPAANDGALDIGIIATDTTNPFIGWLTSSVKEQADAEGISCQIADAGGNATKQIELMENYIAMGVKAIGIWPLDPNNLYDVIKKAQDNGIKVLVGGSDTGIYDVMMNMDQYNCGEQIAEMGIEWLLKTYSTDGTPEGMTIKPKVIVIKYTGTPDSTNRSNGIIDKITSWGYADVIVAQGESITANEARSVMENMWQQNSDATLIMTYNADSALGVNEYIMGLPGIDLSKMALYSGDTSDAVQELIDMSVNNESIFRGTMAVVGPAINGEQIDLPVATYQALKGLADGTYSWGPRINDTIARYQPAEDTAE